MEEGQVPGTRGTRGLQAATRGTAAGGRRHHAGALPGSAVRGLRPARVTSALSACEAQPVSDVPKQWR
eukprot:scaffold1654_cov340-Prasinococcus_capsulatus_cf.AAC.7